MMVLTARVSEELRPVSGPVKLYPHHFGVFCSNLERSVLWWEEILGFTKMDEQTCFLPDYGHARMAWLKLGDIYVELFDFPGLQELSNEEYWGTYGTKHLCLCTKDEDFDAFLAYLDEKNVPVIVRAEHPPEVTRKPEGMVRAIFINDPDGNRVEIQSEQEW